jgi:hypothetical protein
MEENTPYYVLLNFNRIGLGYQTCTLAHQTIDDIKKLVQIRNYPDADWVNIKYICGCSIVSRVRKLTSTEYHAGQEGHHLF